MAQTKTKTKVHIVPGAGQPRTIDADVAAGYGGSVREALGQIIEREIHDPELRQLLNHPRLVLEQSSRTPDGGCEEQFVSPNQDWGDVIRAAKQRDIELGIGVSHEGGRPPGTQPPESGSHPPDDELDASPHDADRDDAQPEPDPPPPTHTPTDTPTDAPAATQPARTEPDAPGPETEPAAEPDASEPTAPLPLHDARPRAGRPPGRRKRPARFPKQTEVYHHPQYELSDRDRRAVEAGTQVFITGTALAKIEHLCDACGSDEVLYHLAARAETPHLIEDVFLAKQKVSTGGCTVQAEDVLALGRQARRRRMTIVAAGHSHGYGGLFSSVTDWNQMAELAREGIARVNRHQVVLKATA